MLVGAGVVAVTVAVTLALVVITVSLVVPVAALDVMMVDGGGVYVTGADVSLVPHTWFVFPPVHCTFAIRQARRNGQGGRRRPTV